MDGHGPRLTLLNGFSVTCAGIELELPLTAQRVLAFLALHDAPVQRSFVAGSLWLDSSGRTAPTRACAPRSGVCAPAACRSCDTSWPAARARPRHRRRHPGRRADRALHAGRLSPTCPCSKLDVQRRSAARLVRRLARPRARALPPAASAHARRALRAPHDVGRFDEALDAGLSSIACEPLRESAHRAVCDCTWPRATSARRSASTACARWLAARAAGHRAVRADGGASSRRSGADQLDSAARRVAPSPA